MINVNWNDEITNPVRRIHAIISVDGNNSVDYFDDIGDLISVDIQRIADGQFFGTTITHRMNFHIRDKNRVHIIQSGKNAQLSIGVSEDKLVQFPLMTITEVNRNENTNELSVTAYDDIYFTERLTVNDLTLPNSYTIKQFVEAIATKLKLTLKIIGIPETDTCFETFYDEGANFEGTESIRECLTWVAQVTQTVCYEDYQYGLVFKRLDTSGQPVWVINKSDYFTLKNTGNRRLQTIASVTTLGDNVSSSTTQIGSTQYVRDNPFWELRTDLATLLDKAISFVGNMTIAEINCSWRGNPAIEIGDKIGVINKDNSISYSYLLNDVITYNGSLNQSTSWKFNEADNEFQNSTTIGEALNQTFARVDKANKEIEIQVSKIAEHSSAISDLQLNQNQINASVEQIRKNTQDSIDGLTTDLQTVTKKVDATMTADQIELAIKSEIANGVSSVKTETGFTFDDEGLTIKKSNSEVETNINENGMVISKANRDMLVVNSEGVDAQNLHATTYLIIGTLSRFEDFNRKTACFWIGD